MSITAHGARLCPRPFRPRFGHLGFNQLDTLPERLLAGRYRTVVDRSVDRLTVTLEAVDEQSREICARAPDSIDAIRAVAGRYRTPRGNIRVAAGIPR
ncbi:hypothetical protein ACFU6R_17025 [Streptomyces sp. NPDC057499]|uniref:hypothetical protein n=1 Tax=Streptomyces sp. NPDC057499 TaxID=3346150 RepID=UPI0036C2FE83